MRGTRSPGLLSNVKWKIVHFTWPMIRIIHAKLINESLKCDAVRQIARENARERRAMYGSEKRCG